MFGEDPKAGIGVRKLYGEICNGFKSALNVERWHGEAGTGRPMRLVRGAHLGYSGCF